MRSSAAERRGRAGLAAVLAALALTLTGSRAGAERAAGPVDDLVSVEAVRAAARARGLRSELVDGPGGREERWCAAGSGCPGTYDDSEVEAVAVVLGPAGARPTVLLVRGRSGGWLVELSVDLRQGTFAMELERGGESATIGWEHRFEVGDRVVATTGADAVGRELGDWLHDELAAYLRSPASFRERALRRLGELDSQVRRALPTLTACDRPDDPARFESRPGPDDTHGTFDTCVRRQLTEAERREVLARLGARVRAERRLVRAHAAAWNAALRSLLGSAP